MGTMQAPVAKFVRTMNDVPSKFVRDTRRGARRQAGGLNRLRTATHYPTVTIQEKHNVRSPN